MFFIALFLAHMCFGKSMVDQMLNKAVFFIFSHIAIFDYFSKWRAPKALRNFEKSTNIGGRGNDEKSYSTCLLGVGAGYMKV